MGSILEKDSGLSNGVEIILAEGATLQKSTFDPTGGMVAIDTPRGAYGVIMCGNRGGGYVPYRTLLPHQIYMKDLEKDFDQYGFEMIAAIPYRAYEATAVAFRNEYGQKRWQQSYKTGTKRHYEFSGPLEDRVRAIAADSFTDEQMDPAIEAFMMALESEVKERIQIEISKRDDQWEKRLQNVRAGLR